MPGVMERPAVSVLLPVYNGERYLAAAIDSILGQTFRDFEFVIIDDGSTDSSPQMLELYAARDSRIRLVVQPQEPGHHRNAERGLRARARSPRRHNQPG